MATETSASDHDSATHELIVKKDKDEAIAQMMASLANEDGESKQDKPDDTQGKATPSNTEVEAEGGEKNTEIEQEKYIDSPSMETPEEHDEVEEAQSASIPSLNTEGEAEANNKKKDEPNGIVVEESNDPVTFDANVACDLKEDEKEEISEAQSSSAAEPEEIPSIEPAVEETPQHIEKECTETEQEKREKTVDIPEASSAETIEQASDAATTETNAMAEELEAEVVVKEAEVSEPSPEKEEKPEPVAETEFLVKAEETEKESEEKPQEVELTRSVAVLESSAEVEEEPSDVIEEKTREVSVEELKEVNKDEAEKTEHVVETLAETIDDATEEEPREPEPAVETLKETNDYESGATETEKAEPVINNEQSSKQEEEEKPVKAEEKETEPELEPETVIPEIVAVSAEKPGDVVEIHPPIEYDIDLVKGSGDSESEVVPEIAEEPNPKPEPELVSTKEEEKQREQLEASEEVEEASKDNVETKKEIVNEATKIETASDDTIKEPISLKGEETSIAENTPQVSSNLVEPSQEVYEKVVEEDESKKESSITDLIEETPKEVVEVVKILEQDEAAKTGLNVEGKKEPEAAAASLDAISRGADVEINKFEELKETITGETGTKVDEISAAIKEPIRETLASKFEEQEEEPAIQKEASATKPAQKQSNNIISKVK